MNIKKEFDKYTFIEQIHNVTGKVNLFSFTFLSVTKYRL